jgi:hypothetical protein
VSLNYKITTKRHEDKAIVELITTIALSSDQILIPFQRGQRQRAETTNEAHLDGTY